MRDDRKRPSEGYPRDDHAKRSRLSQHHPHARRPHDRAQHDHESKPDRRTSSHRDRRPSHGVFDRTVNDSFFGDESLIGDALNVGPSSVDDMHFDGAPPGYDCEQWRAEHAERFTFFFTKKYVFSNHRACPQLSIDGRAFSCTEHYYMYAKAVTFGDAKSAAKILAETDPKTMKTLGSSKNIRGYDAETWIVPGQCIMMLGNWEKYKQNRELRLALLRTYGTTLVECNPKDERWGIAMSLDDDRRWDRANWRGENWLGEILTSIRQWMWTCPDYADEVRRVTEEINGMA